jgi:hypothetical protein
MPKKIKIFSLGLCIVSIITGILCGLTTKIPKDSNQSIFGLIEQFKILDSLGSNPWYKIAIHNLSYAFITGILGFLSAGIFSTKLLFNWWTLWIFAIKIKNNFYSTLFILFESIGMTLLVVVIVMSFYDYVIEKKISLYKILSILISTAFIIIGAVMEANVI